MIPLNKIGLIHKMGSLKASGIDATFYKINLFLFSTHFVLTKNTYIVHSQQGEQRNTRLLLLMAVGGENHTLNIQRQRLYLTTSPPAPFLSKGVQFKAAHRDDER